MNPGPGLLETLFPAVAGLANSIIAFGFTAFVVYYGGLLALSWLNDKLNGSDQ